jgi:hypothetical protein
MIIFIMIDRLVLIYFELKWYNMTLLYQKLWSVLVLEDNLLSANKYMYPLYSMFSLTALFVSSRKLEVNK